MRRCGERLSYARVVNLLADLREGVVDPDESLLEFLRRLEIVDGGPETPPQTTWRGDPEPTAVTLFLTTACNLRCTYCYASAGDTPLRFMGLETAQRGIDFVLANARKKGVAEIEISYHGGGEPTTHWRVMVGSLDYAREVFSESNPLAGTFFYGRPENANGGYQFELPVLNNLRRQTVENREYCQGCFAKWSCAGDCYHKSLDAGGGTERCHITRELTKDQILAKIAASGGLVWHEESGCHEPVEAAV